MQPKLGVGAVIMNSHDEVLLVLRNKEPEAGKWSIPGGKLELYEKLEDAVIREIKEEIGVDMEVVSLLCTAETISPETKEHWVSCIYTGKIVDGEVRNMEPDAARDVKWFPLHGLPDNLACFTEPAVKAMLQNRNQPK